MAGLPGTTDALFERMRLYANALERTSPLVFVGREDELRTLKAAVELVASSNFFGMTHIVQGVPSTGKSSLCDQFLGAVQGTDVAGKVALCARMDPSVLDTRRRSPAGRHSRPAQLNKADYYRKRIGTVLRRHATALGGLAQATAKALPPPPIPSMTQHLVDRYTRKLDQGDPTTHALASLLGRAASDWLAAHTTPRQRTMRG